MIAALSEVVQRKSVNEEVQFLHLLTEVASIVAKKKTKIRKKEIDVDTKSKKKTKKKSRKWDKEKSGKKSTVTIYHTLTKPINLKIKRQEDIPPPNI